MAVLLLCYKGDRVALAALAKLTNAKALDDRCNSEFDDTVEEPFGLFRVGSIACEAAEKKMQRVVLGFLDYGVGVLRAIDKTGHRLSDAVLVATAHDTQIAFMAKAGKDMGPGHVAFQGERAPLTDVPNALLVIGKGANRLRIEQLAKTILQKFIFPGIEPDKSAEPIESVAPCAPVEHESPQVG
jgi:hypothetical protein